MRVAPGPRPQVHHSNLSARALWMTEFCRAGGPDSDKFWIMLDCGGENTVPRIRGLLSYLIPCAPGALVPSPGQWEHSMGLCTQAVLRCSRWARSPRAKAIHSPTPFPMASPALQNQGATRCTKTPRTTTTPPSHIGKGLPAQSHWHSQRS